MGKMSRTKGHSFERWCANALRVVFPEARRQLEYHVKDANGIDLQGTGRYKIQCKRFRKYASISAIFEVKCGKDDVPVLVTRGDNSEAMAVLPLVDLIHLIAIERRRAREWWEDL